MIKLINIIKRPILSPVFFIINASTMQLGFSKENNSEKIDFLNDPRFIAPNALVQQFLRELSIGEPIKLIKLISLIHKYYFIMKVCV